MLEAMINVHVRANQQLRFITLTCLVKYFGTQKSNVLKWDSNFLS